MERLNFSVWSVFLIIRSKAKNASKIAPKESMPIIKVIVTFVSLHVKLAMVLDAFSAALAKTILYFLQESASLSAQLQLF